MALGKVLGFARVEKTKTHKRHNFASGHLKRAEDMTCKAITRVILLKNNTCLPVKIPLIFCYKHSVGYGPNPMLTPQSSDYKATHVISLSPQSMRLCDVLNTSTHQFSFLDFSFENFFNNNCEYFFFFGSAEILADTGHG